MKALIIDDSLVTRKLIRGILLSSCGFSEVVQKENGSTGLRELLLNSCTYDLVILDWYMPVMDGIEVLLAIRDSDISVPVIICTSADDKESIINAVTAGANDYLIKPFEPGTMQAKVASVIKTYNARIEKKHEKRVLVIDDSEIVRLAIKKILLDDIKVDEVVFATDGVSALENFKKQKFNLLLLDWQMPKMDGLQVLKEIRKSDATTPVIMATANTEIEHMVSAFDAGATNFIPKPFEKEDLIEKVSQQLSVTDRIQSQVQSKTVEEYYEPNQNRDSSLIPGTKEHCLHLSNSTKFEKYIEIKWIRAYRMSCEVAVVFVDIDFLKQYKDMYGKVNKEDCLQRVGKVLLEDIRNTSAATCRYNDAFWGVFFPDTKYNDIFTCIRQIIYDVNKLEIEHQSSYVTDYVTVAIGAVVCVPKGPDDRFAAVKKAQENLSLAKEQGNQYKISK